MVNPLTLSRTRKLLILKESIFDLIDLTQLKYVERDSIHMAKFRKLRETVKELKESVK